MDQNINNLWVSVQNHSRCFEQLSFVYPVISRRSRGLSLGVNLNPDKVCNYNCVYCEVDRKSPGKILTPQPQIIYNELNNLVGMVRSGEIKNNPLFKDCSFLASEIKDFAFSGDGEPTLVKNFDQFVKAVAQVRTENKLFSTKIILITNASCLNRADVKLGIEIMDQNNGEIWGKLDAGTERYHKLINRTNVSLGRTITNLTSIARCRPIVIQSMFLKCRGQKISNEELEAYCARLTEILKQGGKIKEVHAYTIARRPAESWVQQLSLDELNSIADIIRDRTNLMVYVFP